MGWRDAPDRWPSTKVGISLLTVVLDDGLGQRDEERLILELEPTLAAWARKVHIPRMTEEDVLQTMRIAALRAIRSHDSTRAPLKAYVITCVRRAVADAVRDASRVMRHPANEVSGEPSMASAIVDPFEAVEEVDLIRRISNRASATESKIIQLLADGATEQHIAKALRMTIDRARKRIAQVRALVREIVGDDILGL